MDTILLSLILLVSVGNLIYTHVRVRPFVDTEGIENKVSRFRAIAGPTTTYFLVKSESGVVLYEGSGGAEARDTFVKQKELGIPVKLYQNGKVRDWHPRN
jgi:hypothetical protein